MCLTFSNVNTSNNNNLNRFALICKVYVISSDDILRLCTHVPMGSYIEIQFQDLKKNNNNPLRNTVINSFEFFALQLKLKCLNFGLFMYLDKPKPSS